MLARWMYAIWIGLIIIWMTGCGAQATAALSPTPPGPSVVWLPPPHEHGDMSLAAAIAGRRSVCSFTGRALTRQELSQLCWAAQGITGPRGFRAAPAVFVITAVFQRTAGKYGERAARYVHLEAGHAAQNLLLQAVALGLGGVPIGAFHDQPLQAALSLPADHAPLYLLAVGEPATEEGTR